MFELTCVDVFENRYSATQSGGPGVGPSHVIAFPRNGLILLPEGKQMGNDTVKAAKEDKQMGNDTVKAPK